MELKTCPFCGGSSYVGEHENHFSFKIEYEVLCVECGSRTDYFKTEEEAIESWNSRV